MRSSDSKAKGLGRLPGLFAVALGVAGGLSCSGPGTHVPSAAALPAMSLVDTAGVASPFPVDPAHPGVTVVVFYADHCPCFRVHEERLRDLSRRFGSQGMRLLVVDSEVSATAARDAAAAAERGLPAIALDPGARLADAVGAEYATFTVVLDAEGRVRYSGGIDSDKERLHDDATAYVREVVEDLLAGREPRRTEGKVLGCALQKH